MRSYIWAAVIAAAGPLTASAAVIFDNGSFVTNPTGGTGTIAGQPISNADPFPLGGGLQSTTAGVGVTAFANTAAADNFVVPAGGADLDTLTVYAFRTNELTPGATAIRVNLWTAAPFDANSPPPLPDPLPQPVLAQSLVIPVTGGTLAAWRQSSTSTSTSSRPVFAYTVSLDGLPDEGRLSGGNYWMQWSFEGPGTGIFFTPLVSPRTNAFDFNARLFNSPFANTPRQWFEGREGFVDASNPGRAYALPFVIQGVIPEPTAGLLLAAAGLLLRRRLDASR
jgi:hypothetical protein